jgi:hypothetical protein
MEFGKCSAALLSKSYTVALLFLSAAAAKKMKEAEVAKKKKKSVGGGVEARKGVGWGSPQAGKRHSTTHGVSAAFIPS